MIQGKTFLVTGGTGSFGSTVVRHLLEHGASRVKVFSRDEVKQEIFREEIADDRLQPVIGDVRDYDRIRSTLNDTEFVFHAAALKQVPACEAFPEEALKTNTLGGRNVAKAAVAAGVSKAVFLSTDKAVYPVNSMGMSKAMMERIVLNHGGPNQLKTRIAVTRYGNVLHSRGSVLPKFVRAALAGEKMRITDIRMTRFLLTLNDSVDLVMHALRDDAQSHVYVRKAPACTVEVLAHAVAELFNSEGGFEIVGVRPGEKLHETLVSEEERVRAVESELFFKISPSVSGEMHENSQESYNSNSENLLNVEEVKRLLLKIPEISDLLQA